MIHNYIASTKGLRPPIEIRMSSLKFINKKLFFVYNEWRMKRGSMCDYLRKYVFYTE